MKGGRFGWHQLRERTDAVLRFTCTTARGGSGGDGSFLACCRCWKKSNNCSNSGSSRGGSDTFHSMKKEELTDEALHTSTLSTAHFCSTRKLDASLFSSWSFRWCTAWVGTNCFPNRFMASLQSRERQRVMGGGECEHFTRATLFRRTPLLLRPSDNNKTPPPPYDTTTIHKESTSDDSKANTDANSSTSANTMNASEEKTGETRRSSTLLDASEESDLHLELAEAFVHTEEGGKGGGKGMDVSRVGDTRSVRDDSSGTSGVWGTSLSSTGVTEEGAGVGGGQGIGMTMTGLKKIELVRLQRPPGRFDLLTNSLAYVWYTNAALARKVSGPLREWAAELKYRTGVHMELEPTNPSRLALPADEGGYKHADEVEITVFLFGSERGIFNCAQLMEGIIEQDPSYVRLAVFRRVPPSPNASGTPPQNGEAGEEAVTNASSSPVARESAGTGSAPSEKGEVEWLLLRRINRELRPPDIPPISLKLPGKHTLLYEQYKEAAIRTLWEETGITVEPSAVFPTGRLSQDLPEFYWRVPVHYFIAEVPYDVEVKGPQADVSMYMRDWDKKLLQQSPDPIDRAWATFADPDTGCAWLRRPLIDELQREWRGDDYMRIRYTPPPYSELVDVVGLLPDAP